MNIFKSCKKTITYLVILSMVVAGVVPTSFVKAEEENTSENTTEDSLIYKNIKGQCGPQTYFQLEKGQGGLFPQAGYQLLFSIQPFANVVGDYTCQDRKHK